MKFSADPLSTQSISSYGKGWINIGSQRFTSSLLINAQGHIVPWNVLNFESLTPLHFESLLHLQADVVLLGSGKSLRFVPQAWLKPLVEQNVPLEVMDTAAACRTFNLLLSEKRRVALAAIIET